MERGITGDLHDFDSTIDLDKVVFSACRAFALDSDTLADIRLV